MNNTVKLPFIARLAFTLISIVLIILLLEQGRNIFVPLVFGLLIAILLYPVNRFFEQKLHFGRALSSILSLLLFLVLLAAFLYFIIFQVINFTDDLPDLRARFQHISADIQHWVYLKFHVNTAQQTAYINKSVSGAVQSAGQTAGNIVLSLSSFVFLTIFVFIFSFFILFHRKLLMHFTLELFNLEYQDKVKEVVLETKGMINGYISGLLLEMIVLSVANSALLLILGVPYAILLGVVAAVLNIIPYLGIYTAIALTVFVTFANTSYGLALQAGLGLLVIHFFDANVLMPRIVGARVKMNPFITILAVIVGEFLWGIPGMFLFIPITGILKLIFERVAGLEAWAILIGIDEEALKPKSKIVFPKKEETDPPPTTTIS